jgi:hypothetical protein
MVLDIQTVHHILKNTAVQNVKQTVCLHYGLDFHFNIARNDSVQGQIYRGGAGGAPT